MQTFEASGFSGAVQTGKETTLASELLKSRKTSIHPEKYQYIQGKKLSMNPEEHQYIQKNME